VAPFGQAPPDFNALTLLSYADTRAQLFLQWATPGVTAPFATLSATQLLISQATVQSSARHIIRIGFATVDPSIAAAGLQLLPDASGASLWLAIGHLQSHASENFAAFSDFTAALTSDLNGTKAIAQIFANGHYDASSGAFSVDQMLVLFDN
jgi:hypothetical protein